jgi:hypothetical protein
MRHFAPFFEIIKTNKKTTDPIHSVRGPAVSYLMIARQCYLIASDSNGCVDQTCSNTRMDLPSRLTTNARLSGLSGVPLAKPPEGYSQRRQGHQEPFDRVRFERFAEPVVLLLSLYLAMA